ncbi:MAG: GNAT family N-acetyltransferase [Alphaproteobacteria bacterium]|jgi:N-acetylglutamate synthase-like GNAT family acetyltransferase|nr:GNAT family N-acetyltransferase [Candidatus Jidaibacter sp.]
MITIELLKNHPHTITTLAHIWHEVLGKIWLPDVTLESMIERFADHLNDQILPITFVALDDGKPVGMCSLRQSDSIRPELAPCLGSLVVDPKYQKQGLGKRLIDTVTKKAKDIGFEKLYLFTFDPIIAEYYKSLGWKKIGMDECKSHPVTVMELEL